MLSKIDFRLGLFSITDHNTYKNAKVFSEKASEILLNNFNQKQKISVFMLTSNTPKSNFGFDTINEPINKS